MLRALLRDLIHAGRSLAHARSYSIVCVVSLGIGMAPVLAVLYGMRIFSAPPPGLNTDGLVEVVSTRQGPRAPSALWSYPDYVDLRNAATGMTMTGWASGASEVQPPGGGRTESVPTLFVSTNYFTTIGVALSRGPGFSADNAGPVVILGHDFWQHHRNADPDIVGKTLTAGRDPACRRRGRSGTV